MSLARELKMTRRQLLNSMDSYELTMWEVFFRVMNKKPEVKQKPEEVVSKLENLFAAHKAAGGKKKLRKR